MCVYTTGKGVWDTGLLSYYWIKNLVLDLKSITGFSMITTGFKNPYPNVRMHRCDVPCMYTCMCVGMYVCMNVCLKACLYVFMIVHSNVHPLYTFTYADGRARMLER